MVNALACAARAISESPNVTGASDLGPTPLVGARDQIA
jgi:hypothetical protein